MMVNIAEKVPCNLKDCISRHISIVGAGSEPWGRPMTGLCQALRQYSEDVRENKTRLIWERGRRREKMGGGGCLSPAPARVFAPLSGTVRLDDYLGAWNRLADDMRITWWISQFRKRHFCMQFHKFIMHAAIPYSFKQIINSRVST